MNVELGRIVSVKLGDGGYDDAMFGFTFYLSTGSGGSVCDFWGTWGHEPNESCKWTKTEQNEVFLDCFLRVKKLMKQAKVSNFNQLKNVPIEITWDDKNRLKSWRILTEVL